MYSSHRVKERRCYFWLLRLDRVTKGNTFQSDRLSILISKKIVFLNHQMILVFPKWRRGGSDVPFAN